MNTEALISVVVPMYNQELYIEKCIQSMVNQTYPNFEMLIVDDGSTDNSADIVKKYVGRDSRIVYLYKSNGGASSARNYGLEISKGEFVCFIDPDDYVKEAYLEELLLHMNKDTDIVIGRFLLEDEICNKTYIPDGNEPINHLFIGDEKNRNIILPLVGPCPAGSKDIYHQTFMPIWKNMYRKSLLDEVGLNFISEREVMFEDYLFNVKAYYYAKAIYLCDSSQYVHCLRQNTLSRRYRDNYFSMIQNMHKQIGIWTREIDICSQDIKIRNTRMETKWVLDVMYNMTYAGRKGLYARIKDVVESDFVKYLLKEVDSFEIESYYRLLYFLLKKKQTGLLTLVLFMFRKLERIYRLYRKRRG